MQPDNIQILNQQAHFQSYPKYLICMGHYVSFSLLTRFKLKNYIEQFETICQCTEYYRQLSTNKERPYVTKDQICNSSYQRKTLLYPFYNFFSHWMGYISYNLFHQIRVYTSNAKGFAILHPQRNQISQSKKIKEKNVISTTSYNLNLDWLSFIPF